MTGSLARPSSASEQTLALGAQDLHLWLCHRDVLDSSDEFRRGVLSRYASVAPQDWRFRQGEHGKPLVLDPPLTVDFNLSHSGDWLACAVTAGVQVGVDIERCDGQRDLLTLARRFFQAAEVADILSLAGGARECRFYDYWTLKEAAIKAGGGALGPELERTGFVIRSVPADAPAIIERAPGEACTGAYHCLLAPLPDYRLAVCWRGPEAIRPNLALYNWREGAQWPEPLCTVLAASRFDCADQPAWDGRRPRQLHE